MTPVPQRARDAKPAPPRPPQTSPLTTDRLATRSPLRCAACDREITDQAAAIAMHGAHDHHFVNPHGHTFHVGIFDSAPGSLSVGPLVAFYSWFPGLPWRLAVCGGCQAHLGWSYGAAADFFALILDRLRAAD